MALPASGPTALAADARSLNALRYGASGSNAASIKEAARQLESLFMRELVKSMRQATVKSGLGESGQADLGTDLLDQQLSVQMAGMPGGLSQAIERQLSRQVGQDALGATPLDVRPRGLAAPGARTTATASDSQRQFVADHQAAAASVERSSGIPAGFMLGQAAHETGWGQRPIPMPDGRPSFNLFGIKAGPGWTGKVAEVTTTEYVDGQARKTVGRFRAYDSYQASFEDYARMINQNPRYAQVRQQTGSAEAFATGLQRAGYATDPQYAAKLSNTINSALRVQRVMV